MNNLNQLICKFCPDGVEYKRIGEIAEVGTGSSNGNEAIDNGNYPFFVRSKALKSKGEYEYDEEAIIIPGEGGIGDIFHYINGKYALHQRVYRIHFVTEKINTKFAYYYLQAQFKKFIVKKAVSSTVASIRKPMIENFSLPIPPLEVQSEIVRILDKFTELTTELALRKKQYQEVSYQFLVSNNISKKIAIGEMCNLSKGSTPIQKAIPGDYPLVVTTSERKSSETFQYDDCAVCIPLVSSRGHGVASLNHVYYQEGKFALGNILCALIPKDNGIVSAKYLYYYFECTKNYTLVPLMKGGANMSMHISDIQKVKVPVPDYDKQKKIITKLEKLDEYCNKMLPSEIKARQKQYEYYRDKLLTFKEIC